MRQASRHLRLRLFQTERVEIFFRDARQSLIGGDRVAAAERLGDHAGRSGRDGRLVSARDLDRFDVAGSGEFGVFVHRTVFVRLGFKDDFQLSAAGRSA